MLRTSETVYRSGADAKNPGDKVCTIKNAKCFMEYMTGEKTPDELREIAQALQTAAEELEVLQRKAAEALQHAGV